MITSLGVGSGLDVENIVSQLLEIEEAPLLGIAARQLGLQTEISSVGQLKASMSALQSAVNAMGSEDLFQSVAATSSDDEILEVTADAGASVGSHTINVTQLAKAHRIGSEAIAEPDTTALGTGILTVAAGESSVVVPIGPGNNTLAGIRDSINGSPVNSIVDATIINTDGGSRLILTARETGTANALTVSVSSDLDGNDTDTSGLSRLVYLPDADPAVTNMTQLDGALDATFTVDSFDVTRASNTIDDVVDGLTFELKAEDQATVSVSRSTTEAVAGAQAVVDSYNELQVLVTQLRQGELQGDSLLLGIESQIRNLFSDRVGASNSVVGTAFEAGFSFNKDGVMSLNAGTFLRAMGTDLDAAISFFADNSSGFATRMDTVIESYVGAGTVLDRRTDSLREADARLELRSSALESQLARTEERIRAQFSALDTLVSNLEVTSNFLLTQLDGLPFSNLGNR